MRKPRIAGTTKGKDADARRCTFKIDADLDIRLGAYARRHRLTRSQAVERAVVALVRGIRLGFPEPAPGEGETAA